MKTIAFFNNKGGVGKTTLACNFAHFLASHENKKILVIDLDPQANATQLLLDEEQWFEIYKEPNKSSDLTVQKVFQNIKKGFSESFDELHKDLQFHRSERFNVDVLAGHPSLSMIEDTLSTAWNEIQSLKLSGFSKTSWLKNLVRHLTNYDFIILDAGPSLGALNRSMLLGVDFFITPLAPDMFSMYSLENIATWMNSWEKQYIRSIDRSIEDGQSTEQDMIPFKDYEKEKVKYVGYTIQEYIARKNKDGSVRTTKSYEYFKDKIPQKITELARVEPNTLDSSTLYNLGTVPHMFSMVALAQQSHAPISNLQSTDGLNGAQFAQRDNYSEQLDKIFNLINARMGEK
ncbi:ParA family protein [Rothia sp. P5764]|uniref:ParA family protein n=1 Tax=Rothia sp. P5764 TaxID=3402654 RepID=UPI003AD342C6